LRRGLLGEVVMAPKTGMYVGIGISTGIVLLIVAVVLAMRMRANTIGEPEATKAPGILAKIDLNLDLGKLIAMPAEGATGADLPYQAMVKLAMEFGDLFAEKIDGTAHPEQQTEFKLMLDKLEDGADKGLGEGALNFDALPELSPKTEWDIRGILRGLGTVGTRSCMSMRQAKDRAGAEKALRAALIWGYRLYKHGDSVAFRSASMAIISEALAEYESHYSRQWYDDPAKAAVAKDLYATYLPVGKQWFDKQKIVWVPEMNPAPGDLWNIAEHDQDKVWRLEAIMWLGISQWTAASGKQRAAVQSYLNEKTKSPDPLIARYAKDAVTTPREAVHAIPIRQ
jgi:hypothetical protein